jgi:hypothetical protein
LQRATGNVRQFPPPGEMADVGGHELHAHVEGTGLADWAGPGTPMVRMVAAKS